MAVRAAELARTLLARRRTELEALEVRARELRATLSEVLRSEQREGSIGRAWLIGSLATGRFGESSDVDVVVERLPPDAVGALWSQLEVRLGCGVDVLRLEALPHDFRARVLREGILLTDRLLP